MRRPVCDHCAQPLDGVGDAVVGWRFDIDGMLVELVVTHARGRGCMFAERLTVGRFVEIEAIAFGEHMERLRTLARAHDGASVTRMARKLRGLRARGAATDGQIWPSLGGAP